MKHDTIATKMRLSAVCHPASSISKDEALADAALRMLVHSDFYATQENTANWTERRARKRLVIEISKRGTRTATRNRKRSRYGTAREHSPRPENLRQSSGQCGGGLVIACVARWQDAVTVHCAIPWARHVASYPQAEDNARQRLYYKNCAGGPALFLHPADPSRVRVRS